MADIFFEIHKGLTRQGPGDEASTCRALGLVSDLPARPLILDVGCGPGAQTLVLARETGGLVTSVDTQMSFLEELRTRAVRAGLGGHVEPVLASMDALPFAEATFDLIWSEGAIYIMGFDLGLESWRRLLRPGGWLAVTELAWLRDDPPPELVNFWQAGYPAMRTAAENVQAIRERGLDLAGSFVLPDASWWDEYYGPIKARLPGLRAKYRRDPRALAVLDEHAAEIGFFERYSCTYGYVFFITRRAG